MPSSSAGRIGLLPGVMLVASMATFAQSFITVKLAFLALFLATSIASVVLGRKLVVYPRLVFFYLAMCVAGIVWALVGLLHPGNHVVGVIEALRLYCIWSVAFLVLFSLLRVRPSLRLLHQAMVVSGILISVINLVGLASQLAGWGLVPDSMSEQMELRIGIHDGYIHITSKNIGALFVIVPYLLALQFHPAAGKLNSALAKVSLGLCLVLVAVSGRRALWLLVGVTPCFILALSIATKWHGAMRVAGRRFLHAYALAAALALGWVSLRPAIVAGVGFVEHLAAAFAREDVRAIQQPYFVDGFLESPVFGSGFGASAGYVRSEARPWTYELTYHQLLFNLGIVGLAVLGGLFAVYLVLVVKLLRQAGENSAIPFGLFVGLCSLLAGAYTNPYFGSFDFLFFAGLLPYLSTFRRGFDSPEPSVGRES